jgi:hypothetical protein
MHCMVPVNNIGNDRTGLINSFVKNILEKIGVEKDTAFNRAVKNRQRSPVLALRVLPGMHYEIADNKK